MHGKTISIRLPDAVARDLDALAQATKRNRNYLITQAVREFVARETWRLQRIRKGLRQADAGDFVPDAEMEAFWASWTTPEVLAEAHEEAAATIHVYRERQNWR